MTAQPIHPVGIVGAGHSGTTIVYRMLALHPDTTWFSQYSRSALTGGPARRLIAAGSDRVLRRVGAHDWAKTTSAAWWRRFLPTPVEASGLWDFAMGGDLLPVASIERIRWLFSAACAQARRSTIVVKPPGRYRSRCAPLISAAYPTARYLHVARDGRAVALSVVQKWVKREPHQRDALLRRGAEHWTRALRQVQEYEQTLPVMVVQYEALCADVRVQLRRMLDYVGLDPDRFPFDQVPPTLVSTNDARLRRAAPDDVAALTRLLAGDLHRYGYSPDRS